MKAIIMELKFRLRDSFSLKDKRKIRLSLIQKLKNKFNISIAETSDQDIINILSIGIAIVSNDYNHLEKEKSRILNFIYDNFLLDLIDERSEYL